MEHGNYKLFGFAQHKGKKNNKFLKTKQVPLSGRQTTDFTASQMDGSIIRGTSDRYKGDKLLTQLGLDHQDKREIREKVNMAQMTHNSVMI